MLHRDVALKVVAQRAGAEKSTRELLLHEARSTSALSHPNICTVHEVGEFAGELYIVMELVEGKPLAELIGTVGVQIAAALAHAHDRNIVHRDLKSANVVVTPQGLVKVLDFGLARRLTSGEVGEATQTIGPLERSDVLAGTLRYMAPEVFRGEPADHRADLWALGVVLYEAAAGKLPFDGRTGFEVSSAILHEPPPPLQARIPPSLWGIIQRCLAKEPAQRYQRASEIQAALEAVQSASMTVTAAQAQPGSGGSVMPIVVHRGMRHLH